MFTIHCTTCDAKLAVKNDELVGQILACPKCGGMVLVRRPEDEPDPIDLALDEEPAAFATFPDPATYETESGIINPEVLAAHSPPPPPVVLPESEIRTRKILLGILSGLLAILVLSLGALVAFKGNARQEDSPIAAALDSVREAENDRAGEAEPDADVPTEAPSVEIAPLEEPEPPPRQSANVDEKSDDKDSESVDEQTAGKDKRDRLADLLARTPSALSKEEPIDDGETAVKTPEIRSTTDLLSSLEKKMPGLLEPAEAVKIDIPARLAVPLAELKLEKTPLLTVTRMFSELTEIPMTLDIDEFRCRGIRIDAPLTDRFETSTTGEMLTKVLALVELEPVIKDRQILVSVSLERRNRLLERTFDIDDLAGGTKDAVDLQGKPAADGELTPERLADILRKLVDPIGFAPGEPDDAHPSLRITGHSLVVRNRMRQLDESLRLLEQLRVVRGLPQTTRVTGENLVPEAFGWDAVMAPMTLNYYQPTPLAGVLEQIEAATKLRILVDHRALHRALCPLDTIKATVRCNRGTVNEAFENLLASINAATLTYRIVDHNVLEITTAFTASQPEKMSIELHRYETPEKPLPTGETPEMLVQSIRSALEPNSWNVPTDGETLGLGDIVIDRPSGCLIVRQSQPVQRQLRLWLGGRLAAPSEQENPAPAEETPISE